MTEHAMQDLQERAYATDRAYQESPHLKHRTVYDALLFRLRAAIADVSARDLPSTLVEVGAGAGGFVEPALAYGCCVTATDMARPALARLNERYGSNPFFTGVLDPEGTLEVLRGKRFSLVLFASVLHHIPDYSEAIDITLEHLEPGGAFMSFQDPLWYPTMKKSVRWLSEATYLAWRLTKPGNYIGGLQSRLRRAAGSLDTSNASDMVEYHVVRSGVNHVLIEETFAPRFEQFVVFKYWSTPARAGQRLGEALGVENTFAVSGIGYRG